MNNLQDVLFVIRDAREMIQDSGPWYHEFHSEAVVKEPWNAYSSLFFLVPVIFWLWRLRGQYRKYLTITLLLPLLAMNGIGSTLYHAFRDSDLALLLDWMPAALMMMYLVWFMWNKVLNKWWLALLMLLTFYALAFVSIGVFGEAIGDMAANLGYLLIGLSLIVPTLMYLYRTRFDHWYLIVATFLFLGIALLFRSLDYPTPNPFPQTLPQGTHFLWHITSAFAVFTMGYYFKSIIDRESAVRFAS